MYKYNKIMSVLIGIVLFFPGNVSAEQTIGCPHDVGKGKLKIRGKMAFIQAERYYSRSDSEMVDLPENWYHKQTKIAMGLEYGIIDRLSVGLFTQWVNKDINAQREIEDNGFEDIWFSAKYLLYSKSPGLFGFDWEDGFFLSFGYKPSIVSDEKIKSGIESGTQDFKIVALAHPHFTEKFFLCSDVWYQYRGNVKEIDAFSKSGWDLGDKFAYRAFIGYEFAKFALVGGPQGWFTVKDKDPNGNEIEDSDKYSHSMIAKLRWMPFGEEDAGSIDFGISIPYVSKTSFAPAFMPIISTRIKF